MVSAWHNACIVSTQNRTAPRRLTSTPTSGALVREEKERIAADMSTQAARSRAATGTTRIGGPVGRSTRGNNARDVKLVQQLLNSAQGMCVVDVTGRIEGAGSRGSRDPTILAIEDFQRRVLRMAKPDGRVDPGGRTLAKLVNPGQGPYFPIAVPPTRTYMEGARRFGAGRLNKKKGETHYSRAHAGCDLYATVGTPIFAVADGEVVADPRAFYLGTDQLSIFHPSLNLTLRYGEIQKGSAGRLKKGSNVLAGQRIASVGRMKKINLSMLHLEAYRGRATPSLAAKKRSKKIRVKGWAKKIGDTMLPSYRLPSLVDPTSYLNTWKAHKPTLYF